MVRQSSLESTQFVRILRSMDGETESADGGLLGDLDGDGRVDLGSPKNTIGAWGVSLGGIITGVLSGLRLASAPCLRTRAGRDWATSAHAPSRRVFPRPSSSYPGPLRRRLHPSG